MEKHIKSVLAEQSIKQTGKSMSENRTRAEAGEAYRMALEDYQISVYEYTLIDDKRYAAEALIDAWRTMSSSLRKGNI